MVSTIRELNDEFSPNKGNRLSRGKLQEQIAHHLRMATDLPNEWIENILELLKGDQAKLNMLHECLLHSKGADRRTTLESVGGLAAIKENVNDWVAFNCRRKGGVTTPYDEFVKSAGARQGLAFWGPPGCGKSLLIKAIVSESRLPTLFVTPSLIQNKYYGETSKRVKSFFELASVLSPCIVVLDELDGLFKSRNSEEIEVSRDLKTEWLQWWDGVASDQLHSNKVLFIGATNRPWDCDPAVWRRLQQRHYVGVPSFDDRLSLFHLWANTYKLPPIESGTLEFLARQTEGYIPSDLYHIMQSACRNGPMKRLDEALTQYDMLQALSVISPTRFTMEYVQQIQSFLGQVQQHQHQNPQSSTDPNSDGGSYFETPIGNYYQFQVPVDPSEMLWSQKQNEFGSDFNSDDFDSDDLITDSDFDEL